MNKIIFLFPIIFGIMLSSACSTTQTNPVVFKGVNLSGAESGSKYPGTEGIDYIWPSTGQIDYFYGKGMNTFRVNFMWERMQPTAKGALNTTYLGKLKTVVSYATSKGAFVLLNPQNFARYYGKVVGSTDVPNDVFADFWNKMALEFKDNPKVMFGLVNEPNTMSTAQWRLAAQAAITSIRTTGSVNLITVPGNGWTGMHSWTDTWYDTASPALSNGQEMLKITDPANNFIYEVHQYFDTDFSGKYLNGTCISDTVGVEKATKFVTWLRANNKKAILGEIGAPNNAGCKNTVTNLLTYLKSNEDVLVGWLWWNSIRDNFWANYQLDISQKNGVDDARMTWLSPYLAPASTSDAGMDSGSTKSSTYPSAPISFVASKSFTLTTNSVMSWIIVPSTYDVTHNTPSSLFVWLHGCGGKSQYDVSLVSPGGTAQTWISLAIGGQEGNCWSVGTDSAKVLAAIADLKTHFNIDPRRVVLGGYSSGGDLTYRTAFYNAGLFAGVLVENSSPFRDTGSTQAASLAAASWKFNVVHLAHLQDTTYPITGVRTETGALKTAGYPITVIEKNGTHWDADTATSGTNYDLRTSLLPYLNAGWLAPAPTSTPAPQPTATATATATTTTTSAPPPAPTGSSLTSNIRQTYKWDTGYCAEVDLTNTTKSTITWSATTLNFFDGVVRDDNHDGILDTWGGKFSGKTGTIKVTPASWNKTLNPGQVGTFGACLDFGISKKVYVVVSVQ